jgi:tetratricopeptide (TPR) repeat protein
MLKKVIFRIILILFPVLIIVLLETSLRLSGYGTDLRLFKRSELYPGYYEINKDVSKRYFTRLTATTPTNDIFLIDKPDTCYRIFVLGCSTTRGFPYQSGTMFSRILYYRLQDAFPRKRIEVVNLSFSAINSFTVKDMTDEVLENKPDAILIYTGHNEYYGTLGVGSVENGGNLIWIKDLQLELVHFRTYQFIEKLILWFGKKAGSVKDYSRGGAMMEQIAKDKSIIYGSGIYQRGITQFETNMISVLEKAHKRGVPVILSELVSNIKDQAPFNSVKTDSLPPAGEIYKQAVNLESEGNFEKARELYYRAKDLDVIRFRSPEDFNIMLHRLGDKYHCPVVGMKEVFERNSPKGIIGNNLMVEHLHPNINGYFLMADAFFNSMRDNGFISTSWDTLGMKPSEYYRNNWGFTELDSLIGDLKIKMLKSGWPFRTGNVVEEFLRSYEPKDIADSLAFKYVTSDSLHIEDQHVILAGIFSQRGDNYNAYREYLSLIKWYPYVNDLYYQAVNFLIKCKRFREGISLLGSAPDLKRDFRYYYTMGILNLGLNNYDEALAKLSEARKLSDSPERQKKVLMAIYESYKAANDPDNAGRILDELKAADPEFNKPGTVSSEDERINELTNLAMEQIRNKNPEMALKFLFSANAIRETTLADKMIGSLYFMQKDPRAYDYYQKAFLKNPLDPEVLNNLFLLALINNDTGQAQFYLDKFRKVSLDYRKIKSLENLLEKKIKELSGKH